MRESRGEDATLVIRCWEEKGHPEPFRARVTYSCAKDLETNQYAANAEQVLTIVREWLAACADHER